MEVLAIEAPPKFPQLVSNDQILENVFKSDPEAEMRIS